MWVVFALGAAFVDAVFFASSKYLLERLPRMFFLGVSYLVGGLALTALSLHLLRSAPPAYWLLLALSVTLNAAVVLLYAAALSRSPLSLTMPLLSLTPVFLLVLGPLLLGDIPSLREVFGVLVLGAGLYVLGGAASPRAVLRALWAEPGVRLMALAAFLMSCTASVDKKGILLVGFLHPGLVYLCLGLIFLSVALAASRLRSPGALFSSAVVGLLLSLSGVLLTKAFLGATVSAVVALKRFSTLFSLLFAKHVFHEKQLGVRASGAALMVAGAVLIILG